MEAGWEVGRRMGGIGMGREGGGKRAGFGGGVGREEAVRGSSRRWWWLVACREVAEAVKHARVVDLPTVP